jgi:hypothetical protein
LLPGTKDGRVSEGAVEPTLGDVAVGSLGEVDAVPAPVVGWVLAGVSPRLAALGRQVEVVLAHAGSTTTRTRRLPQEPCAGNIRKNSHQSHVRTSYLLIFLSTKSCTTTRVSGRFLSATRLNDRQC